MKKHGILNSDIARVLSYMGHTDRLCIGDCGLPVPDEVERIDLALRFGLPSFMETLRAVGEDMKVEKIVLAKEIREMNPALHQEIMDYFRQSGVDVEIEYTSHKEFKKLTEDCKAVIHSGEDTPYANIILQSACIF